MGIGCPEPSYNLPGMHPGILPAVVGGVDWWVAPGYGDAILAADLSGDQYMTEGNDKAAITDLFSITRTSVGIARDNAGAYTSFASGIMRRTDRGLLLESARRNNCLQSEALDTTWTTASTLTSGETAPDGTSTAFDVKHGGSTETVKQTITTLDNKETAIHAHVKQGLSAGGHDWCKLAWLDESDGDNGFEVWFNLATGSLGTAQLTGTGSYRASSAFAETLANGWFRFGAVGQIVSGQTDGRLELINTTADAVDTAEETDSVLWWGMGQESNVVGNAVIDHTSYIKTTTVALVRQEDAVTVDNKATIYADNTTGTHLCGSMDALLPVDGTNRKWLRDTTTADNMYEVNNNRAGSYDGANTVKSGLTWSATPAKHRVALAYTTTGASFASDGTTAVVSGDTTGFSFGSGDIDVGGSGGDMLQSYLNLYVFWVAKRTDGQIETSTTLP